MIGHLSLYIVIGLPQWLVGAFFSFPRQRRSELALKIDRRTGSARLNSAMIHQLRVGTLQLNPECQDRIRSILQYKIIFLARANDYMSKGIHARAPVAPHKL
jgi:hypothetical protein